MYSENSVPLPPTLPPKFREAAERIFFDMNRKDLTPNIAVNYAVFYEETRGIQETPTEWMSLWRQACYAWCSVPKDTRRPEARRMTMEEHAVDRTWAKYSAAEIIAGVHLYDQE